MLACLALVVAVAACGSDADGGTTAGGDSGDGGGDLPVVTMQGFSSGLSPIVLKVIQEQGFDEKNGFEGEYLYLDPGASTQTFLQGESDVAFDQDIISVAIARSKGYDVTAFYPDVVQTSAILVAGDSDFKTPSDLVGKKVGQFGLDSGTTTSFAVMLDETEGIDVYDDYQLAEIGFGPSLGQVLDAGQVDGIFVSEPLTTNDIVEHGSREVFNGKQEWDKVAGFTPTVNNLAASEKWIEENPELAYGVRRAYQEACAWMLKRHYDFIREEPYKGMLGLVSPEAEDLFIERAKEFGGSYFSTEWGPKQVQASREFVDLMYEAGILLKEQPEKNVATQLEEIVPDPDGAAGGK